MTAAATLARIRLSPLSRAVQRDLRDATDMHRTLMRLVPDALGEAPRRAAGLLYRVDEDEHGVSLLVQATGSFDPTRLPAGYGSVQVKDLAPMFAVLRKGLAISYRITVNPVKRQRVRDKRGKIVPLSGSDADQWWTRRAHEAGLDLHTLLPSPLRSVAPLRTAQRAMRHSLIRYDGTATITDPDALTSAVLAGIGRAKSYGAGLLSLAPAAIT
jgi:CRISPR system Cascade subunit CasE